MNTFNVKITYAPNKFFTVAVKTTHRKHAIAKAMKIYTLYDVACFSLA